MFRPEMYEQSNTVPRQDALETLQDFSTKIHHKSNEKVIDLGCGDGSVTSNILKRFLNPDFAQLIGCDISTTMVQYANEKFGDEKTAFIECDVGGDIPVVLKGTFDHVFSSYALHWIPNQDKLFANIYDFMGAGGDCLLVYLASTPVFDFYRALSRQGKWQRWVKNQENYISPFHDSHEPEKIVRRIMADIGFKNIEVQCKPKTYIYKWDLFTRTMESINPFVIPMELQEEFMEDYIQVVRDLGLVFLNEAGEERIRMDYRLLVAYGMK